MASISQHQSKIQPTIWNIPQITEIGNTRPILHTANQEIYPWETHPQKSKQDSIRPTAGESVQLQNRGTRLNREYTTYIYKSKDTHIPIRLFQ